MDVEKKRSKGGFLHLFDWPGKSRKKLFANSSEPPDETKKERSEVANFSKSQPRIIDRDDTRTNSSNNARSDFSCRSSVASDEEHETRAPSVVARLMGLDSLPVPTVPDSRINPTLDAYILESSRGYEHSDYICFPNDLECIPRNHVESRTSRPQNRPLERFKTEMLPPKSAKPIPMSHNRLLSPIRGPGFVPIKNPAYIMEAASRMIETSPRVLTNSRVSTVGSSSVPMRIRDLKEKLEAAHKSSTVGTSRYPREGQAERRRTSYSQGTTISKNSGKRISDRSNIGGKSASPAVQAKTNFQKRESMSSYSRVSNFHKEKPEAKNRVLKNHSDVQRSIRRATSANSPKTVLRQNNQKQNCKDSSSSNSSVSNQQGRKVASKEVNKIVVESESGSSSGSKKTVSSAASSVKVVSLSRKRIVTRNKKSPDGYPEKRVCDDTIKRNGRSIKCNVVDEDTSSNQKNGVDVISFTFSSPIKGHGWDPQSSSPQGRARETSSFVGAVGDNSTHTTGYNIIPGDSLSVLLEQKLRELNCKFESFGCGNQEESSVSTFKEPSPSINGVFGFGSTAGDDQGHDLNQEIQIKRLDEVKGPRIDGISSEAWKEFDHRQPSLTTDLSSSCNESCADSRDTNNGITHRSLFARDPEDFNWVSPNELYPAEEDNREVSESASMATFSYIESEEPDNWELQYINSILNNSQLMLEPFVLGETQDIIPLGLFEQLEEQGDPADAKIERKTLFDCVIKCLKSRQEQYLSGRLEEWAKDATLFERKDWLAEELYKEISGWKSMGDLMVDELVDKDMSSLSGRWIDYKNEAFEEGVEIVKVMVSALVDDLIHDLLVF